MICNEVFVMALRVADVAIALNISPKNYNIFCVALASLHTYFILHIMCGGWSFQGQKQWNAKICLLSQKFFIRQRNSTLNDIDMALARKTYNFLYCMRFESFLPPSPNFVSPFYLWYQRKTFVNDIHFSHLFLQVVYISF